MSKELIVNDSNIILMDGTNDNATKQFKKDDVLLITFDIAKEHIVIEAKDPKVDDIIVDFADCKVLNGKSFDANVTSSRAFGNSLELHKNHYFEGMVAEFQKSADYAYVIEGASSSVASLAPISGTYASIKQLKDDSELIPGRRYSITDYKTKYFIENSNSSAIIKNKYIYAYISGWAVINNIEQFDIYQGLVVEITELPAGYSGALAVGQTTTVNSVYNQYYFKFANGMQSVIGLKFKYQLQRYQGIAEDAVINDANGKPIMIPGGIVNTTVHDDTAYMDMSAAENFSPVTETLILTALTTNTFDEVAYSETFSKDIVYYDIDDNEVKNDNDETIDTRNGFVSRRVNKDLNIDAALDWRNVRYRRWLIDTASRDQFLNKNLLTTDRVGYDGKYLYTSVRRNNTQDEVFYIATNPEKKSLTLDADAQKIEFSFVVTDNMNAKDFPVFKLDSNRQPVKVIEFKTTEFANTVFFGISGEFDLDLKVNVKSLKNSTFISNIDADITNGILNEIVSLDSMFMNGVNTTIDNIKNVGYARISNMLHSKVKDSIFGVLTGNIAGNPTPAPSAAWMNIDLLDNSIIGDSVIGSRTATLRFSNTKVVYSNLFVYYSPTNNAYQVENSTLPSVYFNSSLWSRVSSRFLSNMDRVVFENIMFPDSNGGGLFKYDITSALTRRVINLNKNNYKLYAHEADASDVMAVNVIATLL